MSYNKERINFKKIGQLILGKPDRGEKQSWKDQTLFDIIFSIHEIHNILKTQKKPDRV